ncbi:MAG: hypothetical protein ABIW84_08720 [Ilumatobacteraceae bacterium]
MSTPTNGFYWLIKRGETGTVRTGTLYENGVAFDLTGIDSLLFYATRIDDGHPTIDGAACVPDVDQTANPGKFSYTFDVTTADILASDYNIEFKATDGLTVSIWPKTIDDDQKYGTLRVLDALG